MSGGPEAAYNVMLCWNEASSTLSSENREIWRTKFQRDIHYMASMMFLYESHYFLKYLLFLLEVGVFSKYVCQQVLEKQLVYPFSFFYLSRVKWRWKQAKQGIPGEPVASNIFHLLLGDPDMFQMGYIFHPASSGSTPVSPLSWTCPDNLRWKALWRFLIRCLPQLTPLNVKEQLLLPDHRAPHPVCKAEPRHSVEEIYLNCL